MCWSAVCPYLELEGVSCNRGRASDVPLPTAYGSQYYSGHAMNPKHMNRWSPRRLWWGKGAPLIAAWTVTAWNRRNKMWQLQWCFLKEREGGSSNNIFHMITVSFWLYSLFRSLNHRNSIFFFLHFQCSILSICFSEWFVINWKGLLLFVINWLMVVAKENSGIFNLKVSWLTCI